MLCKGITVFRDGSRSEQVVYVGSKQTTSEEKSPAVSMMSVAERPKVLVGKTAKVVTAMGSLYVTLNCVQGAPFECFIEMGRAGSDIKTFTEALARLISISLRAGVPLEPIVNQLKDIRGTVYGFGPARIQSVPDGIAQCLQALTLDESVKAEPKINFELCPDCGVAAFIRESGCGHCTNCPYSECN